MSAMHEGKGHRLHGFACVVAMACAGVAACVSVERTLPDGSVERVPPAELPEYAQTVFKRHNAVSTALLEPMVALDESSPDYALLADAEDRMIEACAPVDALAIAYRDGERIGFSEKLRLARALESCEQATEAAASQLDEVKASARTSQPDS